MSARCPWCETKDVEERLGVDDASDGPLHTTHFCPRCHRAFRYTPPEGEKREAPCRTTCP